MALVNKLEDFLSPEETINLIAISASDAPLAIRGSEKKWFDVARMRYSNNKNRLIELLLFIDTAHDLVDSPNLLRDLWIEKEILVKVNKDLFNGLIMDFSLTHGVMKKRKWETVFYSTAVPLSAEESVGDDEEQYEFIPYNRAEIGDHLCMMVCLVIREFYRLPEKDKRWFDLQVEFGANKGKDYV